MSSTTRKALVCLLVIAVSVWTLVTADDRPAARVERSVADQETSSATDAQLAAEVQWLREKTAQVCILYSSSLHCALSCAVYYNRPCLFVCVCVFVCLFVGPPYYSQRAVFASLLIALSFRYVAPVRYVSYRVIAYFTFLSGVYLIIIIIIQISKTPYIGIRCPFSAFTCSFARQVCIYFIMLYIIYSQYRNLSNFICAAVLLNYIVTLVRLSLVTNKGYLLTYLLTYLCVTGMLTVFRK